MQQAERMLKNFNSAYVSSHVYAQRHSSLKKERYTFVLVVLQISYYNIVFSLFC